MARSPQIASLMPPDPAAAHDGASPPSLAPSLAPAPAPSPSPSRTNPLLTPPATSSPSSPSSPGPARPSLLSRLSLPLQLPLPLRSKNRNVADFHIRCDEPHKKYAAGDSVRGAVVLVVVKPLRITHLVVALHGYVRVFKDPTSLAKAQSTTTLPPSGSSRRPQYRGNGLTSLFQDEQLLSGEGRIEPGKYEFGFDLVFPDTGLPSSIDFERGTISYTITATLTRPTTIVPTSTCDRKVTLIQAIDIGLLSPPRPRTIFLEPISKPARRKKSTIHEKPSGSAVQETNELASSEAGSSILAEESTRGDMGHDSPGEVRVGSATGDMQSEMSGESVRSASTTSRPEFAQLTHVGSALTPAAKQQVVDDKTITATIELLKGGCLPGEAVTVRVTVQHIKTVKSMTGVIVTLFRQSKIDTNPQASQPVEGTQTARRSYKEDPYPRSRTGLAGLSLSSTSSTSVFRKDLDQNAAPLIIDPATLQASVTVSVRVPDDAFPTIKGVPSDMISFKYQAEVIVDLGGRLTTQLGAGSSSAGRFGASGSNNAEHKQSSFGPQRGSNIADTSQVRRQKGVISVSLETVVGTMDSGKLRQSVKGLTRQPTIRIAEEDESEAIRPELLSHSGPQSQQEHGSTTWTNGHSHLAPPNGELDYTIPPPHPSDFQNHQWTRPGSSRGSAAPDESSTSHAAPSYIPSPQMPNQANLTEKERIRQAETRLLPSQPPAGPSSLTDEADIYSANDRLQPPSAEARVPSMNEAGADPSAPTLEQVAAGRPAEDKQELERRRLMEEASAPPDFPDDMERPSSVSLAPAGTADHEPTAPSLNDDDDDDNDDDNDGAYGVGAGSSRGAGGSEQLPAYRR